MLEIVILVFSCLIRLGWGSKSSEESSLVSGSGSVVGESKGNKKSKQACVIAICMFRLRTRFVLEEQWYLAGL